MLQMFTATKDETCYQCHCNIPEGTRYWAEQTVSGKRKKQHTNCDLESAQHQVTITEYSGFDNDPFSGSY